MPPPDDGAVNIPVGAKTMAEGVDISNDCCELVLEESMGAHSAMMLESRANGQSAHSVVRHSGARKFNQEDPIEAASVEMILKKA